MRASSRPKNSSTKRRATCVDSTRSVGAWNEPTLSARLCRSATDDALGANGSWTCTKSSGATREDLLDRARDVHRRGRQPAAPLQRQQLADAEHPHAPVGVQQRLGVVARRADQPPRLAHQRPRPRRRQHQHPVAARRQLLSQLADESIDLVFVLPRMRRDLRDGVPFRHRPQDSGLAPVNRLEQELDPMRRTRQHGFSGSRRRAGRRPCSGRSRPGPAHHRRRDPDGRAVGERRAVRRGRGRRCGVARARAGGRRRG